MYCYVTMHNAYRHHLLAGPYTTEADATRAQPLAAKQAAEVDPYTWFHTYSLARSEKEMRTVFGKI